MSFHSAIPQSIMDRLLLEPKALVANLNCSVYWLDSPAVLVQ